MIYDVAIIEGEKNAPNASAAADLHRALTAFVTQGWEIFTVLPNGLNRWTIISRQPTSAPTTPDRIAITPELAADLATGQRREIVITQRYVWIGNTFSNNTWEMPSFLDRVVWQHDGIAGHAPLIHGHIDALNPSYIHGYKTITVGGIPMHVDDFADLLTTLGLSLASVMHQIETGQV